MNKLAQVRNQKGLTRAELAVAVGVSERHIAFIETGKRSPSIKLAFQIVSVLDTKVDEIFLNKKCT